MNAISPLYDARQQPAHLTDLISPPRNTPSPDHAPRENLVDKQVPTGQILGPPVVENDPQEAKEVRPITIDDIMNAWGTSSERYDLNGDGIVSIDDVFVWLGNQAAQGTPGTTEPPIPLDVAQVDNEQTTEVITPITLDDIMNAWGTASERYDLNGDGTVSIDDVFVWLGTLAEPGQTGQTEPPIPPGPGQGNDGGTASEVTPITIEDIMNAWGTASERYDLNGDGIVSIDDVFAFLGTMGSGNIHEVPVTQQADSLAPPHHKTFTGRFVQNVVDTLDKAGFDQKPPTNIHRLIEGMKLAPSTHDHLLQRLVEHYPDGLGIDLEA